MPKPKKKNTHGGRRPGSGRPAFLVDATPILIRLERKQIDAIEAARNEGEAFAAAVRRLIAAGLAS